MSKTRLLVVLSLLAAACGGVPSANVPLTVDPGTAEWVPVARDQVAAECGLAPDLLDAADQILGHPWAVIRHGKLCHEYSPTGDDPISQVFSATKTLGAVVTGIAAYRTRDLERTGPKTGPVAVEDRVDHWLDEVSFNPDAQIGHLLGMVAFNDDLSPGNRSYVYDLDGSREINRLSDILNTAIVQDTTALGANLDEFSKRFLFEPLGMRESTWLDGNPRKIFGWTWASTVRDMARLGLMLLNGGVWNGERVLGEDWVYAMTHPSFEDANVNYGYLTWLKARTNPVLFGECMPAALWNRYPHGSLSGAADCNYAGGVSCDQQHDVGAWSAIGMFGQYIHGHPALDLVIVGKDMGDGLRPAGLWNAVRPALVALDPLYRGDDDAFCAAYGANAYAPDGARPLQAP